VELKPGDVIATYRIEQRLGAGSMGDVFRALDEPLSRRVAIKILAEQHRESDELRARFLREARAVAAINHSNVVQVFTVGHWDSRPYFAMEYLSGPDLGHVVRERGPMRDSEAAAALLGAARGLRAAAHKGLIHRDVKPSNLMVSEQGEVKVADFGLAKGTDIGPGLTATGIVVGTPDYIAPEQARGETIDHRADIYALGCTLFHLVSGRPPYRKVSDTTTRYMEVVMRHLRDPVPDLIEMSHSACDSELAGLCTHMMAKTPAERPSYDDVIDVLESITARMRGSLRMTPIGKSLRAAVDTTPSHPTHNESPLARKDESSLGLAPPRKSVPTWLWTLTAMSLIVFLVGLALHFFGGR
jgi:serine/threonine-protein kinase